MTAPAPEPAETSTTAAGGTGAPRPGRPEMLVGLVVLLVVAFGVTILVLRTVDMSPQAAGVFEGVMSGAAGIAAFLAATRVRGRPWRAFGVRATSWTWLAAGVAGGVLALAAKIVFVPLFVSLTGVSSNPQSDYAAGSTAGAAFLVLNTIALAVITPIGEELFFRGVLTTGLLRYGPAAGVVGSAVVFALCHGINVILPAALIVGLINAELRRRSGSVWPGVLAHAVNNLAGVVVYALLPA